MNNEKKYNPEIHCCRYWYKDFCECSKNYLERVKKKSNDRNINDTLNFLRKNNIEFIKSKVPNIVIINPKTDKVFLSLKKEKNLFKCRFKGNKKWYSFSKQKFIDNFSQN